ncbi:MAG: DNA-binding transcriptional MerR regulator [Alcanivorax sp.]|jgi:DNA-binding transcriptional MerR regulator
MEESASLCQRFVVSKKASKLRPAAYIITSVTEAKIMETVELQPRPLYGIGTVSRLTGIKADTLRVWERRYDLVASHKTSSGRRQYTRAGLEHLQLIAALLEGGARIGEIASAERKTLESLLRAGGRQGSESIPTPRPRVVFVGEALCRWLADHQGAISNVDALLAEESALKASSNFPDNLESTDTLVVGGKCLNGLESTGIIRLCDQLKPLKVLVCYESLTDSSVRALQDHSLVILNYPLDAGELACHLNIALVEKHSAAGATNIADLVNVRPHIYSESELQGARLMKSALDCECPQHLADLISALNRFESHSVGCSTESWEDAAVHACVYTYTAQARWLMEKALDTVIENRRGELVDLKSAKSG